MACPCQHGELCATKQWLSGLLAMAYWASLSMGTMYQNLYRSRDEIREWQQRDPIQYFVNYLTSEKALSQEDVRKEEAAAYAAVEEAYQFGLGSPDPDPETLLEGVYA